MPAITIPNQTLTSTLTYTEFNQLLDALKSGYLDITTGAATVNGALTVTGSISSSTQATLSGGVELNNGALRGMKTATFNQLLSASTTATSYTIDWTAATKQRLMPRANCTLTFTAPVGVGRFDLRLIQDSVGSRVITWPSTVKWVGNTAPTLTTTAFKGDYISFDFDGTNYIAAGSLAFTGI